MAKKNIEKKGSVKSSEKKTKLKKHNRSDSTNKSKKGTGPRNKK